MTWRDWRDKQRLETFELYSRGTMTCSLCPESRVQVLDIDHIFGGGRKAYAAATSNSAYYTSILKEADQNKYRILCRNCNHLTFLTGRSLSQDKESIRVRNYYRRLRLNLHSIYGNICSFCSENRLDVLDLDHVTGGGGRERKLKEPPTTRLLRFIAEADLTKYRILCRNCNWIAHRKGTDGRQDDTEEAVGIRA